MIEPFFTRLKKIDEIIKRGPESCDFVRDIEPLFIEEESKKHFFYEIKDSGWLKILISGGQYISAPKVFKDNETETLLYPSWPEANYLIHLASTEPEKVINIVKHLPETENFKVHDRLVDIALVIPPSFASDWVMKYAKWIEKQVPLPLLLPDKLGKLISHLSHGKQKKAAIKLAKSILAILPDPERDEIIEKRSFLRSPKPHLRFKRWNYEKIFEKHIPNLANIAGLETLEMVCGLLDDSIRLSRIEKNNIEDYSDIWRPAIEDHNQNMRHGDIRDILVSGVRNVAESIIEKEGKHVFDVLNKRKRKIFKRIELFLRQKWSDIDPKGTEKIISDIRGFNDNTLHHEYFHLLKNQFDKQSKKIQKAYLQFIEQGIAIKKQEWLDYIKDSSDVDLSQMSSEKYGRIWQYRKLVPIKNFLNLEWQKTFQGLQKEFEELEHIDFKSYSLGMQVVVSPISVKELLAMGNDDLISYLLTWEPSNEHLSPSHEELSHAVSKAVASDPERFVILNEEFQKLKPNYVRAFFWGLQEALKDNMIFSWDPVIDLCIWVIHQPNKISDENREYGEIDPDWQRTRQAIADIVSKGLNSDQNEIPYDYRAKVWDIIKPLTEDLDFNEKRELDFDPSVLSINSTQGIAMHDVFHYALWVRRHLTRISEDEKYQWRGFEEIPEVRKVLTYRLKQDRTLTIRSIYGRWFPWLLSLDEAWTVENRKNIFPIEKELYPLRNAAWESYIVFNKPYKKAYELLKEEYRTATETIGSAPKKEHFVADPDKRLSEHIMTLYWWGNFKLDNPSSLLIRFYKNASDELRSHAHLFIGKSLKNTEDKVSNAIIGRLKKLWKFRMKVAYKANKIETFTKELSAFGRWFTSKQFDDEWSLEQLEGILKITGEIGNSHSVMNRFIEIADERALQVIQCIYMMVDNAKERWDVDYWKEDIYEALSKIMQAGDSEAKMEAEKLINELGSRGYLKFGELL